MKDSRAARPYLFSDGQNMYNRVVLHDIKDLPRMSMEAAIKLFHIKVLPIATYGLQLIWEHLPAEAREGESNIPEKGIMSIKTRPITHRV